MTAPPRVPAVLVLGAGVNGCAVARELLLGGVSVCVVDSNDVATGATAKSSRLIHGGLRYLEYGEFDLVRESLGERARLLRLAPQYVQPLRLYIPAAKRMGGLLDAARRFFGWSVPADGERSPRGLCLIRLGLWLYDLYARKRVLPRHQTHRVGEPDTPRVNAARFRWLASYSDAQMLYPERFVLALLEDARQLAAKQDLDFRLLPYHHVRMRENVAEIDPTGEPSRPAMRFQPAAVVNATGAWADLTLSQLGVPSPRLTGGTKGSHLLVRSEGLSQALDGQGVYAEAADGRLVFVLPAGPCILVGTTDLPFEGDPGEAIASEEEINYLMRMTAEVFTDVHLAREDVDMHYSGVRPLPSAEGKAPGAITRRHEIHETDFHGVPVYTLVGGKLTTCRTLAEQVADRIFGTLGTRRVADSRDRAIPGGEDYPIDRGALHAEWERLAQRFGIEIGTIEAVWSLVGTRTAAILSTLPEEEPQLLDGTLLPIGFARWVIREEWVSRLEDLVERRLMLLYHPGLTRKCLRQLAGLLVEAGRLDAVEVDSCVARTRDRLQHYYGKRVTAEIAID